MYLFLKNPVTLPLLMLSSVSLLSTSIYAEPEIRWRQSAEGTVKLQVQDWTSEDAPELQLSPLSTGGDRKPQSAIALPALIEMSVKSTWQLAEWKPADMPTGIYRFSFANDADVAQADTSAQPLEVSDQYQSVRAEIQHQDGKVSWSQPVPGAARVLLQFPSGLTVSTLSGWQAYGAGKQEIISDLIGEDGIDYRFQPNLLATVQIAAFPSDVYVSGMPVFTHPQLPQKTFKFGATTKKVADSDQQLLRVELTPETLKQIGTGRFEILIYADGVFVHEESQGVSPYTYIIPDNVLQSAKQLTLNLLDYEGNWAAQTVTLSE